MLLFILTSPKTSLFASNYSFHFFKLTLRSWVSSLLHLTSQRLPNPPTGNQIKRFSVAYLQHSQINVSFFAVSNHSFINKQLVPCIAIFLTTSFLLIRSGAFTIQIIIHRIHHHTSQELSELRNAQYGSDIICIISFRVFQAQNSSAIYNPRRQDETDIKILSM